MAKQILQVTFEYSEDGPDEDLKRVAEEIAEQPGLLWKLWPFSEERNEAGGIYLFEDEESVIEYMNSDRIEEIVTDDRFQNVEIKRFELDEELTEITGGKDVISVDPASDEPP